MTRELVQNALNRISSNEIKVDEQKCRAILEKVKAYFESDPSGLSGEPKQLLAGDCRNADVHALNYVAFDIWLAMKSMKSREIDLGSKFAVGSKVELTLVVVDIGESTYKTNYRAFGSKTEYFICECEEYPEVDFRVSFGSKMPDDVIVGDVIRVKGTVKSVDERNTQVRISRAVVIEKIGHEDDFKRIWCV